MPSNPPFHQKPSRRLGRPSVIGSHPQREAIETACAAGISLRLIAERFGVGAMSVHRWWHSLPPERRAALAADFADLDDDRWREVTAGLVALARQHPEARADVDALTRRLSALAPGRSTSAAEGGSAHAA